MTLYKCSKGVCGRGFRLGQNLVVACPLSKCIRSPGCSSRFSCNRFKIRMLW